MLLKACQHSPLSLLIHADRQSEPCCAAVLASMKVQKWQEHSNECTVVCKLGLGLAEVELQCLPVSQGFNMHCSVNCQPLLNVWFTAGIHAC